MTLGIELDHEDDGRWLAEVPDLSGVLCYGETRTEAPRAGPGAGATGDRGAVGTRRDRSDPLGLILRGGMSRWRKVAKQAGEDDGMRAVSTRTAAERCAEMQKELPERSEYLEACRDLYRFKADGIERASNLDAVLRAAAGDTLHQGPDSADGANRRRNLKGCHRIVLPGTMGPVRAPAWLHFETTDFPPDYSLVQVTMPDRAIESVEIAGTRLRPTGPPVMTVACFGHPAKVDAWIQAQRGRQAKVKTTVDVWEYYRSCGIAPGPAACATASRLPVYGSCIHCREMIGPKGCVNVDCPEHDGSWLTDLSGGPDEGYLKRVTRSIIQAVTPSRIVLFGSGAREEMGPKSDIDLFVAIRDGDRGEATKCILRAIRHEEGQPLIDPYVVHEAQMDQWKDNESTVIPAVLREGRTLYAA